MYYSQVALVTRAPRVILGRQVPRRVDVWAVGMG